MCICMQECLVAAEPALQRKKRSKSSSPVSRGFFLTTVNCGNISDDELLMFLIFYSGSLYETYGVKLKG